MDSTPFFSLHSLANPVHHPYPFFSNFHSLPPDIELLHHNHSVNHSAYTLSLEPWLQKGGQTHLFPSLVTLLGLVVLVVSEDETVVWWRVLAGGIDQKRNWTCTYCNIIQPPRAKHCHDCDKCVLQFDHHCVWLGTCIGQGNHCRFWWYIFEETMLCIWTGILYISFLHSETDKAWWQDCIAVVLLAVLILCLIFLLLLLLFHSYLVLTNQTTYELVRRRRILYLRGVPERVHPFSKGICRNLYNFCFSRDSLYAMEPVPRMEELQDRARPYTCCDLISCRCF